MYDEIVSVMDIAARKGSHFYDLDIIHCEFI